MLRPSPGLWLGRFAEATTLSATQAFAIVGAHDAARGRRVVVVAAQDGAERTAAAAALDHLYRAHRDPPHASVAAAVERGGLDGTEVVVIDFPGRFDLEGLLEMAADAADKAEVSEVDGVTAAWRDAIVASGARVDGRTGRPMTLGTIVMANVLFAADGRSALLGFGHNVAAHDEHGRFAARGRFFQAPEIAAGGAASAMSDYIAMVRMTRAALTFVNIPEAILRCFLGQPRPEDAELRQLVVRFETQVLSSPPDLRPPLDETLGIAARIRELIGSRLDAAGFARKVAGMVRQQRPDLCGEGRALVVARDRGWVALDGARLELTPLQGRLVGLLVAAHRRGGGQVVPADDVIAGLWPSERMSHASSRNRLYVTVSGLRKLGFDPVLEQLDGGYRLAVPTVVLDEPGA